MLGIFSSRFGLVFKEQWFRFGGSVAHTLIMFIQGSSMKMFNKLVKLIILIILISGIVIFAIYLQDVYYKGALSQEKQNSQLLENTCDEVEYNKINCDIYKSLAKELDNFNLPKFTQHDIYCLSTTAISVELPPLTPPVLVEVLVSESMDVEADSCDIDEVLERVRKNVEEYQQYKRMEKEANKP